MKKTIIMLLFLAVITSCKKSEPLINNETPNFKLNKKMDVPVTGPLTENAFYVEAYQIAVAEVSTAAEALYPKIANNTATDAEQREFLANLLGLSVSIYESNPGFENLSLSDRKTIAFNFIYPLGSSSSTALCLAEVAVDLIAGNLKLIKNMGAFAKLLATGNHMQRSLLIGLGTKIAKDFAKNLPYLKAAIFIYDVINCLAGSDVYPETSTEEPVLTLELTPEQEVYNTYLTMFEATTPTIDNLKYFLLQGIPQYTYTTYGTWNSQTNQYDYSTVQDFNPAYYSIFDSTNYNFLKEKITISTAQMKAYLDLGPGSLNPIEEEPEEPIGP